MKVYINGNRVQVAIGSENIDDSIEERSTASFKIQSKQHYYKGQCCEINDWDNNLVFAGFIDTALETRLSPNSDLMIIDIQCIDNHYLADKRIIAKSYVNMTSGEIVQDIVANYLAIEGVTIGEIQSGITVESATFNYCYISKALDDLVDLTQSFIWYIDYNKKLYFVDKNTYKAPTTITWDIIKTGSDSYEHSNTKYRNRQTIKGGHDITDPLTENKKGDGATRTWSVGFPIAKVPTVKLNNNDVTVGIRGVDTGKQYYWSKGDNTITQDDSQTILSTSDALNITYQGQFDLVVITQDDAKITELQVLDGTSGIVEELEEEQDNTTRDMAFQNANALLQKYSGKDDGKLVFSTLVTGFSAGQIASVNLPEYGLENIQMLIEDINIMDDDLKQVWYKVTAVLGTEMLSWQKMFLSMSQKEPYVIQENINQNEVLIIPADFSKTWQATDTPNIFKGTYASNDTFPEVNTYPMFDPADRIKSLILLDSNNNIIIKKQITKKTTTSNTINSICYIAPYEANSAIAKVQWFGGFSNNVKIDEQAYSRSKTQYEAIQVNRTDTMGFTD